MKNPFTEFEGHTVEYHAPLGAVIGTGGIGTFRIRHDGDTCKLLIERITQGKDMLHLAYPTIGVPLEAIPWIHPHPDPSIADFLLKKP